MHWSVLLTSIFTCVFRLIAEPPTGGIMMVQDQTPSLVISKLLRVLCLTFSTTDQTEMARAVQLFHVTVALPLINRTGRVIFKLSFFKLLGLLGRRVPTKTSLTRRKWPWCGDQLIGRGNSSRINHEYVHISSLIYKNGCRKQLQIVYENLKWFLKKTIKCQIVNCQTRAENNNPN